MFGKKQSDAPEVPNVMAPLQTKDDALFEALGKSKRDKKRKLIRAIVIIVVVLAVLLFAAVSFLRRQVREQFMTGTEEVLSQQAQRGTISTVVSGSGMLLNVDTEVIDLPSGVEVTELLVQTGDEVKEGELLAIADMATVRTTMSRLQEEIEDLDDQITAAKGDTVSSYISAGVPGRVKRIYGETDMPVQDAMVEYGGLAVISLDGYMAVDMETDELKEGDTVTVILSDGEEETGTVKSVVGKKATILLTDDGPKCDEEVSVECTDGSQIGSGKLYIHNPLMVTGYAGTVKSVKVEENQKVYSATTLFTLTDTSTTASYDALLRSRGEKEEELLELLRIQHSGGLTAPISGSVYSTADLDEESDEIITDIITLSPDVSMSVTISVDEADILSLELGQEAEVTVSSVSEETLTGTVTEIDKTDSSGAYTAVITLDKAAGMLPGMTASVDVRIEGVEDAILIPVDALHQTSTGYYVFTSYDEETREYGGKVDVIPGISNSNDVEIKSGLQEGDTVYYTEAQDMFGGMGFMGMGHGQMPNMGGNMGANAGAVPNFGGSGMPDRGGQSPGGR